MCISSKKEQVFIKATKLVFDLECEYGHEKWSIAELARRSNVSRALIYKYLGNSKEEIIISSLRALAPLLYGYGNEEREGLWREGRYVDSILIAKKFVEDHLSIKSFYFQWVNNINAPYRLVFLDLEERYQSELKAKLKVNGDLGKFYTIRYLMHGYVMSPFADRKSIEESFSFFIKNINL